MNQADIIDGTALATRIRRDIQQQVHTLSERCPEPPGLAVVLVGQDPASQVYVRNKRRQTLEVGMRSFEHNLPETTSQAALIDLIHALNNDSRVNGILVQLPLPRHISSAAVLAAIDPHKDVDGFHEVNTGRLWHGEAALVPCTPLGCIKLLKHRLGDDLSGLHAVVIGTSNIVGKPLSSLLLRECCTVTMTHEYTRHLPAITRQADILVAAAGRANLVRGEWIKRGATVIDVGINRVAAGASGDTHWVGDVAFGEVSRVAAALTPVPGGVGPMTVACLLQNTLAATVAALKGVTRPEHSLGISA